MSRRPPLPVFVAAVVCFVAVSRGGRARGASETLVRPAPRRSRGPGRSTRRSATIPWRRCGRRRRAPAAPAGARAAGRGGFGGGGADSEGGRGGFGGGGRGGRRPRGGGRRRERARGGRESSGTPNELLWDEHRLVVTDGIGKDPKFVVVMGDGSTRTLYTDGRKVEVEETTGTTKIKAKRKSGKVVVDTEYPNGREVVETWELLSNPRLLVVTTKVGGKARELQLQARLRPRARSRPRCRRGHGSGPEADRGPCDDRPVAGAPALRAGPEQRRERRRVDEAVRAVQRGQDLLRRVLAGEASRRARCRRGRRAGTCARGAGAGPTRPRACPRAPSRRGSRSGGSRRPPAAGAFPST